MAGVKRSSPGDRKHKTSIVTWATLGIIADIGSIISTGFTGWAGIPVMGGACLITGTVLLWSMKGSVLDRRSFAAVVVLSVGAGVLGVGVGHGFFNREVTMAAQANDSVASPSKLNTPDAPASSPVRPPTPDHEVFLRDLPPLSSDPSWSTQSVIVAGVKYDGALTSYCGGREYYAGGKYKKIVAGIGKVDDTTDSRNVKLFAYTNDTRTILREELSIGQFKEISLDITNVARIKFNVDGCSPSHDNFVALINAKFVP